MSPTLERTTFVLLRNHHTQRRSRTSNRMINAPTSRLRLPVWTVILAVGAILLGMSSIWFSLTVVMPVSGVRNRPLTSLVSYEALTIARGGLLVLTGFLTLRRSSRAVLAAVLVTAFTAAQFLWQLDNASFGRAMSESVMPVFLAIWALGLLLCLAFVLYLRRLSKIGLLT